MQLSVNKLPWYGQVGVFVAVAAAALFAYFYFYENAARAEVQAKERQLETVRAEIARGQAIARQLPEFRAQVADLEARLDNLRAVLPEQKDVGDLLRRIQTLATQSNLEIRAFKPQAVANKEMHAEWPIELQLDGTYHDLGMFFDRVSKVPRIINISSLDIEGRETARGQRRRATDRTSTITAGCVATTFVLVDRQAVPQQAGANAKGKRPAQQAAAQKR